MFIRFGEKQKAENNISKSFNYLKLDTFIFPLRFLFGVFEKVKSLFILSPIRIAGRIEHYPVYLSKKKQIQYALA
jgi:hypothetical protein